MKPVFMGVDYMEKVFCFLVQKVGFSKKDPFQNHGIQIN